MRQEIEALPGVLAAALWLEDLRRVREVHVTATQTADRTAVLDQLTERLKANGLAFAEEAIHLTQVEPLTTQTELLQGRYLVLEGLEVTRSDGVATCRVRLRHKDEQVDGEVREMDTAAGRARAAARAVLAAAEKVTRGVRLGLEGAQIIELFTRQYVILSVEATYARHRTHLAGIGIVDRSTEDAACLAALGAIDRWLAG